MAVVKPEEKLAAIEGTWTGQTYDSSAAAFDGTSVYEMVVNEDITASGLEIKASSGGTDYTADYIDTANVTSLKSGHRIVFNRNELPGYITCSAGSFTVSYLVNNL